MPCRSERSGRSPGSLTPDVSKGWELPARLASAVDFLLVWQISAMIAGSRLLPTVAAVAAAMVRPTFSGALPWNLAITLGGSPPHSRCRFCLVVS
jgi:ABC-type nitrate/sulfonate/bicarbonate transport system permease component